VIGRHTTEALAALCLVAWMLAVLGSESYGPTVHLLPLAALVLFVFVRKPAPEKTSYQRWLKRAKVRR
jgi:hypothetical protein